MNKWRLFRRFQGAVLEKWMMEKAEYTMNRLFYSEVKNDNREFYMKPAAAVLSACCAGATAALPYAGTGPEYDLSAEMPGGSQKRRDYLAEV